MGIWGLQKYISEKGDLILKPFSLCNSYLVVDGNCICFFLYTLMQSDSAFGGDYDEYYSITKTFFKNLQKCKVIPIVIFDGGHEKEKIRTVLRRIRAILPNLELFNKGYSKERCFPLFLKVAFVDVLDELNIIYFQSELEADPEIATLAKALNCPVLSYDSDFYIYDVLYIPFSSVTTTPVRIKDANFKGYAMPCMLYDLKNFLNVFSGLEKPLMPIAATLLGNDYNESYVFEKFFLHVIIPFNGQAYSQRKIHGVLHWLKKENFDSAVRGITGHLGKKMSQIFLGALNRNVKYYEFSSLSPFLLSTIQKLKINNENISKINEINMKINVPPYFREMIHKGKIPSFVLDMIYLRTYFTFNQVENLKMKSTHFWSLRLIAATYAIVKMFCVDQSQPLTVYMINSRHYNRTFLNSLPLLDNFNLSEEILKSRQEKLELIYRIIAFSESDIEVVSKFHDDWLLFMASLIYWLRSLESDINSHHAKAIILGAVCNRIVQKHVGYYRNKIKFLKDKGELMGQLKITDLKCENNCQHFSELIRNVTMFECLSIQKKLIPIRQTSKQQEGNVLDLGAIHYFNAFQSCLFHIAQLNIMLNNPLPNTKISDFYSGTLTYNIYVDLKRPKKSPKFEEIYFKDSPNVYKCIEFIENSLKSYLEVIQDIQSRKKKRQRRKTPIILGEDDTEALKFYDDSDENDSCENDSNEKYNDENNHYFLLKNFSRN